MAGESSCFATSSRSHLPDEILTGIFSAVSDTRTRHSLSLVSRSFFHLERRTRTSLTLRFNVRDLHLLPNSFTFVTDLDISLLSPWGSSLFSDPYPHPRFLARHLRNAFPRVTSLTVYVRSDSTLQHLLHDPWPQLRHVKLVRWHQSPQSAPWYDLGVLFQRCTSLQSLDLSSFYQRTEDVPLVMVAYQETAAWLKRLNLMTTSFTDGYKTLEIQFITEVCPNLEDLRIACNFDPRFLGYVGDEALLAVASNCPKLKLLHLVETSSLGNRRGDPDDQVYTDVDARISRTALGLFFSGLPLLEELVLDVGKNVRASSSALGELSSKCPNLKVLKLGHFHGICSAIWSQPDGIALCQRLESLSIKNCADLTDMGLIEIAKGCSRLVKFEIEGCRHITEKGLRTLVSLLCNALIDVKISCCFNLDTAASLRALESIRCRIERLHVDCKWDSLNETGTTTTPEPTFIDFLSKNYDEASSSSDPRTAAVFQDYLRKRKRSNCPFHWLKTWDRLKYLSLWIEVGEELSPLLRAGLESCPILEEIRIRVEGDCRLQPRPSKLDLGLSILAYYPRLRKMQLDCGDARGYALTAPPGQVDLSLWERFFLSGIRSLDLHELDYWPPQDEDLNRRSLSHIAAGLIKECRTLRNLFIHGTANEHFMRSFLQMAELRDVQLRADYHPAPQTDTTTEMRATACTRLLDALNNRLFIND